MARPKSVDDSGDLDGISREEDDSPPDPGGAADPDAIPADLFIERMERSRAARARQIRKFLGEPSDDIPDRLPEHFFHSTWIDGEEVACAGPPRRRGRVPGSKNKPKPQEIQS